MLKIACNLCQANMKSGDLSQTLHFCERCLPHSEEYMKSVAALYGEAMDGFNKKVERLRADTLRTKISNKSQELKSA